MSLIIFDNTLIELNVTLKIICICKCGRSCNVISPCFRNGCVCMSPCLICGNQRLTEFTIILLNGCMIFSFAGNIFVNILFILSERLKFLSVSVFTIFNIALNPPNTCAITFYDPNIIIKVVA